MRDVALFTRAWIEMAKAETALTMRDVALFTRAWIEMKKILLDDGVK